MITSSWKSMCKVTASISIFLLSFYIPRIIYELMPALPVTLHVIATSPPALTLRSSKYHLIH